MNTRKSIFYILCMAGISWMPLASLQAQYPVKIHSHNDYRQTVPFYQAYAQKIYSIEVDLFYRDGEFFVAHDDDEIRASDTFDALYLQPLLQQIQRQGGKVWMDSDDSLQLLLEIKSDDSYAYLKALEAKLKQYPQVFCPVTGKPLVRIVMTGNIPAPQDFDRYATFILFDGDIEQIYTSEQLERIGLFSVDFGSFSRWNGKGSFVRNDREKVEQAIRKAHVLHKPIRFWGAPDGITAWNTFLRMGVDYINTDRIEACADFFRHWHNKHYQIEPKASRLVAETTRTDRLDRSTRSFEGFRNEKLQLTRPVETYTPSYQTDGQELPVKNVILLIGDGMGLAQLTAAQRVNQGLSILHMKYTGLVTTSSKDAFTTDSAGAGSALATGEPNCNRHISVQEDGTPYPTLTDYFVQQGKACGIVTMGNVADATPAAFYGHTVERDNAEEITRELLKGQISLLAGSGTSLFTQRQDGINLQQKLREQGVGFVTDIQQIATGQGTTICLDERMGQAAEAETIDLLAQATHQAIRKLSLQSPQGFFLMVEGAKIDYAGHSNCFPGSVVETLGFDLAVAEALRFADQHGETLVLVTGDHETGGLTLIDGDNDTGYLTAYYVTDDHTPTMLPVFAYGPQSQQFIGSYANYEIARKVKKLK